MKKRLMLLSKRFLRAELVRGSFYIMITNTIGGILGLLFNLFLLRVISIEEYGIYTTLASFSSLAAVFSQAVTTVIMQYAAPLLAKHDIKKAAYLYFISTKIMLLFCILIILILISFSGMLGNFLHISNSFYFLLVALSISLSYFGVVNSAFLQGLLKFGFLAWSGFIGSISRVIFGVIVVLLGFHVVGAFGSLIVVGLLPLCLGFFPLRFLLFSGKEHIALSKKDIIYYAFCVAVVNFSLTSFTSSDILLVKHFFSPTNAGLYSAMSVAGKAIFYFTAPISTVLFPLILKKYHKGEDFLKTFYAALLLVFFPSMAITLFYFLFPHITLLLLLGGKYSLTPYIGFYGLYISIFSMLNVSVSFLLSLKKISIIFPMTTGALLQVICISIFHNNFFQVITVSLIIISILLVGILLYYVKYYGSEKVLKKAPFIVNNTGL